MEDTWQFQHPPSTAMFGWRKTFEVARLSGFGRPLKDIKGHDSLTAGARLIFFPTFGQRKQNSRRAAMLRLVDFLRPGPHWIPARGEMVFAVAHAVRCERHRADAAFAFFDIPLLICERRC